MFSSNVDASAREVAIQLLARREYSRAELARRGAHHAALAA